MAIYDGHVSLGEDRIHVILGVEEEKVTLSSSGREIGIWGPEEIEIRYLGNGRYAITAEDETLEFVPLDHDSFAIQFGEIDDSPAGPKPGHNGRHSRESSGVEDVERPVAMARPPRSLTRVAFYGLAAFTGGLGLWAAVSMLIG